MRAFDPEPVLTGGGLILRPLAAEDEAELAQAASDPLIWAGHPSPDRHRPDEFARYFAMLLGAGGTLVVRGAASGKVIGCSRYYPVANEPGGWGIGFTFLTREHWGGATNFELKRLMHGHAFGSVEEVWYHIAPTNLRSQVATTRLGARHRYDAELDLHGAGRAVPYRCYTVSRSDWQALLAGR